MRWDPHNSWRNKRHRRWYARVNQWHSHFAWRKVTLAGESVWLEWVERRVYYFSGMGRGGYITEYREAQQ